MITLGVVAIGRNEGERLRRCLASIGASVPAVVYVDSGSMDDSVQVARSRGATVVQLDQTIPFTAARARNEGFAKLLEVAPDLTFVQFVDGDCEIDPDWLDRARSELDNRPDLAVVCGRLRERFPEASWYNRLCDMEWDCPPGQVSACGGNAMYRTDAFRAVGGFRVGLAGGEEPELCLRLRSEGWKVWRVDAEMAQHDAAMTRFGQWWRRNVRAGYAYAECSRLHQTGPQRLWVREARSNWFWGLVLPTVIAAGAFFTTGLTAVFLLGYLILGWRIYRSRRRLGNAPSDARLYALFCILGKPPQVWGQLRYYFNLPWSRRRTGIESPAAAEKKTAKPGPVAYLVNQYPHVSHSFVRREIAALEAAGIAVARFSIRQSRLAIVDPADAKEQERTEVLLGGGFWGLVAAFLQTALTRPIRWLKGLSLAVRIGRRGTGRLRHLVYLAEACVLVRCLRKIGARHLHVHFGTNSATVALLAHQLSGLPYSMTIHGPEEFDRPESLCLAEKIDHATFVVAVSEFGRSQVFRWCKPENWCKIHVVRCGVDASFLHAAARPMPATNRLVCVGRLCEQKGQLRLLEALSHMASLGVGFEMELVGDGPMRPEIENQINHLGLAHQVRITGWVGNEAVRDYILDARGLVLPSFAEGLPVVLMEALALGRPVVSTYVAGIPELVENGVNGWLVPAGSVEALTKALQEILEAPIGRLTEMGLAGSRRVAALHDASREASRLARLFSQEGSPP